MWNQCATCNLFRNGAGAEYTRALEKKFSTKFVDKIIKDKNVDIKLDIHYVDSLREYYETLLDKDRNYLLNLTKKYNGYKND